MIVGVIDSGIWPESRSFRGKPKIRRPHAKPIHGIRARWTGRCEIGERFIRRDCNRKLIGARYYVEGFGKANVDPSDFISPRDGDGHGSHTASTAAGKRVRDVVVDGKRFGTVSGMAPAAKVAAYKVCWTGSVVLGVPDGCFNSDSVAAIDQAVADGVDVINYSIGSTTESSVLDEVELAFLFSAAAGVYNAVSAGNSGPGESTLDHPSPWVSTTAASTHRIAEKKLVLGNGRQFIGASTTPPLPSFTPMVMAEDSGKAGVDPAEAALCASGTLDPAKVSGKLVVCIRGVVDRVEKSFTVAAAGGAGMVLINPSPNSLNGDLHAVPSVHIADTALAPVSAYVAGASPVGKIVRLSAGQSDRGCPRWRTSRRGVRQRPRAATSSNRTWRRQVSTCWRLWPRRSTSAAAMTSSPVLHGLTPQRRARRPDPAGTPEVDPDGGEVVVDDDSQEPRLDERQPRWGVRPGRRLRPAELRSQPGHRVPPWVP